MIFLGTSMSGPAQPEVPASHRLENRGGPSPPGIRFGVKPADEFILDTPATRPGFPARIERQRINASLPSITEQS